MGSCLGMGLVSRFPGIAVGLTSGLSVGVGNWMLRPGTGDVSASAGLAALDREFD